MDNAELGRRLKAARLSKKMTQSDVVGTFITRNMLSQIESGSATPSMKTLEYLAGVLELPMERLLSGMDDSAPNGREELQLLTQAKDMLKHGEYERLLRLEVSCESLQDELCALQSMAHLALARQLAELRNPEQLQTAVMHARNAAALANEGLYASPARAAEANQLITELARYLSSYYSSLAQEGAACAT